MTLAPFASSTSCGRGSPISIRPSRGACAAGTPHVMHVTSALLALAVALVSVTVVIARTGASADADFATMGATALRTSWYPNQPGLSPSLVAGGTFGQLFSANVVGQVYAQPLVSQGTLLVATEGDNVYGLDPASGAQRWVRNLHTPWNPADLGCGDLTPAIGITGTPTIDPATNTGYLLAKTYRSGTSGPAAWWAHAIDVATGAERPGFPVLIQGLAANDPTHAFNATNQMQRPGLLLMNRVVYAGFGGHCDFGPYEGWVVGISTAGRITTLWTTEAQQGGSPGAGIWQSGGGLVSDGPGRIFLSTGNGNATNRPTPGASPPDALGEAVVRLAVQPDDSLRASDFFVPYDAQHLNEWDADVGSGAPVALPSEHFGTEAHRNLMVQVGKQGYVYLLDRDHLGGFAQGANGADAIVSRIGPYGGVWSKPAVWPGDGGYVYVATASGGNSANGTSGYLRAYKYGVDGSGTPALALVTSSADAFGFSSGPPAVTSDGTASGTALLWIVWSPDGSGNGAQLRAYDAVPVDGAFALRFSAPIGQAAKFSSPGIDANRVYVGTRDGRLLGFGAPVDAPLSARPLAFPTTTVGQSSLLTATFTANQDVTVSSLATNNLAFTVGSSSPPAPARLLTGQTLTGPVTFTPGTAGLIGGNLTAEIDGGSVPIGLTGTGQSAAAQLAATPPALSFGGVAVNGPPALGTAVLMNTGAASLTITGVTLPGPPYTVTNPPAVGSVIGPGEGRTVTATFAPTAVGLFTGELEVATSAGIVEVPVSGSAGTPGRLEITPSTIAFGPVVAGSSAAATFRLTNTGGSALTITKSKPPASGTGFAATTSLVEGTTVLAGASLTQTVRFAPEPLGARSDAWLITADDGSGPHTVTLTGTGARSIALAPRPEVSSSTAAVTGADGLTLTSPYYEGYPGRFVKANKV